MDLRKTLISTGQNKLTLLSSVKFEIKNWLRRLRSPVCVPSPGRGL
jgi:hypothetical protein